MINIQVMAFLYKYQHYIFIVIINPVPLFTVV